MPSNSEQLDLIMNDFKQIARLHKSDLESTSAMPNYNASFTQLIKIKKMIMENKAPEIISASTVRASKTIAEMRVEILEIVAPSHVDQALALYESMKKNLGQLTQNVSQQQEEKTLSVEASVSQQMR